MRIDIQKEAKKTEGPVVIPPGRWRFVKDGVLDDCRTCTPCDESAARESEDYWRQRRLRSAYLGAGVAFLGMAACALAWAIWVMVTR